MHLIMLCFIFVEMINQNFAVPDQTEVSLSDNNLNIHIFNALEVIMSDLNSQPHWEVYPMKKCELHIV